MTEERPAAPGICLGFEIHRPYRLNLGFEPAQAKGKSNLKDFYFSGKSREKIERLARASYLPAIEILLGWLEEGFSCSFALSGVAAEQLERWAPEVLDRLQEVSSYANAEFLGETYYHSIAGIFPDSGEYEEQIRMHRELMRDLFGRNPRVLLESSECLGSEPHVDVAQDLGFSAICIEGFEHFIGDRSPNYIYTYDGVPLLMKNCRLSEDIAVRFCEGYWDQYPLTADKYAGWVSVSNGDCITVILDLELFGRHYGKETGILEFLKWLPVELEQRGVQPLLPSEAAALPAKEALPAGLELPASSCLGNILQNSAFSAIHHAGEWLIDKGIWRYLQADDYFNAMAMKSGSCGKLYRWRSHQETFDFFTAYMRILSHYEERCTRATRSKKAAYILRTVPHEKGFHFWSPSRYMGFAAYSLEEFLEMLEYVPEDVLSFHMERHEFSQWIACVYGDEVLAGEVDRCQNREDLKKVLHARISELRDRLR